MPCVCAYDACNVNYMVPLGTRDFLCTVSVIGTCTYMYIMSKVNPKRAGGRVDFSDGE